MKKNVALFIDEVIALSRKYGVVLSHEDDHGGFIIQERGDVPGDLIDEQHFRNANYKRYVSTSEIEKKDNKKYGVF